MFSRCAVSQYDVIGIGIGIEWMDEASVVGRGWSGVVGCGLKQYFPEKEENENDKQREVTHIPPTAGHHNFIHTTRYTF